MRGVWRSVAFLLLVLLCVGLAQTSKGHGVLRDVGLFQVPPSYTELAFTDPRGLPLELSSKQAPIHVSFNMHNVSGSSRAYHWSITMMRSGKSHLKASGVTPTTANGSATVARTVSMPCVGGRLQVVVRVAESTEPIDFWVACQTPSGGAK